MRNCLSFAKLVKYIESYPFDEFFNSSTVDDFIDYLYENSEEYQMGEWRCAYGATKLVIIMEEEDFVFKIPFNSEWDSWKQDYIFFCGAPATSTWDYCEAEEERYDFAEEYGFSEYLAKTNIVYNTKNGVRIYIQPKCSVHSNHKTTSKRNRRVFSKWFKGCLPIDDTQWLNTFVDCYGAYKLKQFLTFLLNEDWDDDLGSRNIGYTIEGKPVLIDYSSYMEQQIILSDLDL